MNVEMGRTRPQNIHRETVEGFGREWEAYSQAELSETELRSRFDGYFSLFPFDRLTEAEGFDLGCGSGRWAAVAAPRVGLLHCIDPAPRALDVARRNLAGLGNVDYLLADAHSIPLADASQDFGYSLGVLHHIPDPQAALSAAVRKLKPGAPFLVYLYYRFDNRPLWFRALWRTTDLARRPISRLPFGAKKPLTSAIAATVYWPLARLSAGWERMGGRVRHWPLSYYRRLSFYTMRTDALDRFGTRLEHRFTRGEIVTMMNRAGLTDVRFSPGPPHWVAIGIAR